MLRLPWNSSDEEIKEVAALDGVEVLTGASEFQYSCPACSKMFLGTSNLRQHLNSNKHTMMVMRAKEGKREVLMSKTSAKQDPQEPQLDESMYNTPKITAGDIDLGDRIIDILSASLRNA